MPGEPPRSLKRYSPLGRAKPCWALYVGKEFRADSRSEISPLHYLRDEVVLGGERPSHKRQRLRPAVSPPDEVLEHGDVTYRSRCVQECPPAVEDHESLGGHALLHHTVNPGKLFGSFTEILACFREEVDAVRALLGRDFLLSAATGWWYEGREDASVGQLGKHVDAIVPMAYDSPGARPRRTLDHLKRTLPLEQWRDRSPGTSGVILGLAAYEWDLSAKTLGDIEEMLGSELGSVFKGTAIYANRFLEDG